MTGTGSEGADATEELWSSGTASHPRLVLICEPIESPQAVQYRFFSAVGRALQRSFDVTIASTRFDSATIEATTSQGLGVVCPKVDSLVLNKILRRFDRSNESTLWVEAWFREAFTGWNRRLLRRLLGSKDFDFVINATNTCAYPSDIWWVQGPPLEVTLRSLRTFEGTLKQAAAGVSHIVLLLERKFIPKMANSARSIVTNSTYLRKLYENRGYSVTSTVFSFGEFTGFRPTPRSNDKRFVLAYIGNETELDTLEQLAGAGVRVVGFGRKLMPRARVADSMPNFDFLGPIDHTKLVSLYSQAEFTVFPFTNEPLGNVPVESMACGTPVLTYNRQGPAETVIDGKTGWLVDDRSAFVRKAIELWGGFDRAPFEAASVARAAELTPESEGQLLTQVLHRVARTRASLPSSS